MKDASLPPDIVAMLRIVTDPTRWRLYERLRNGSASVGTLATELQITEKLVSHHLQVLRRSGIVHSERDASDARWVYYQLNPVMLKTLHDAVQLLFTLLSLS